MLSVNVTWIGIFQLYWQTLPFEGESFESTADRYIVLIISPLFIANLSFIH